MLKLIALLTALLALTGPALVAGHGAVIWPPPRNAIDKDVAPWNRAPPSQDDDRGGDGSGDGGGEDVNGANFCIHPDRHGRPSNSNGQACFWFSTGCIIGCDVCNGIDRGYIKGDPSGCTFGDGTCSTCPDGKKTKVKPTICSADMRTVNTDAECMSHDDHWQYTPWRYPGMAPVRDSCGMAGGHLMSEGGDGKHNFGADYRKTKNAKLGDLGSKVLPYTPTGVQWKVGSTVNVSWALTANHAGGYQYRLCPRETLDNAKTPAESEACFQSHALDFANNGTVMFRWRGDPSTDYAFQGTVVTGDMVVPKGSMWMRNPVPRSNHNDPQTGKGYPAYCPNTNDQPCVGAQNGATSPAAILEIIDHVVIPADLKPGQWVLGWRWDCEESNQIWATCSDIDIVA